MVNERKIRLTLLFLIIAAMISGCAPQNKPGQTVSEPGGTEAVYLGVNGYGTQIAHRSNMDSFQYRFMIDGEEKLFEIDNGPKNEDGEYTYPIQNVLKIGYTYMIDAEDGVIKSAEEVVPVSSEEDRYTPPVTGEPGVRTVKNFLKTALEPVGTTLYIYGGGWDWQDVGASIQVRTIGVSEDWVKFFNSQDASFTYRDRDGDENNKDPENSYYPYNEYNEYYYAGLDCSGFVGWALNNTFNKDRVDDNIFSGSTKTAMRLAQRGWGERVQDNTAVLRPGDVVSISGHVWISLGTCSDGSIVIMHSTPSVSREGQPGGGVQISAIGASEECEAYKLADKYMSEYFKEWYSRYPVKLCDRDVYLDLSGENPGIFSWDTDSDNGGLTDPDGFQSMDPSEVLAALFE